jgi:hypothetical protein
MTDYIPVQIPIHSELNWKLRRLVSLINNTKTSDEKKTTYVSIINDCIAKGIEQTNYAELLNEEYQS